MNILSYNLRCLCLLICLLIGKFVVAKNDKILSCGYSSEENSKNLALKYKLAKSNSAYLRVLNNDIPQVSVNSVPLAVHIIRKADGSGGLKPANVYAAIENLNPIYKGAFLEFFVCGEINYIDDNKLYNFTKGDEKLLKESDFVSGSINLYFTENLVNDAQQNICGYADNAGRNDTVVISNSCINDTTLAHELGHFFSLLHTHGPDNSKLTTELVDGSNCDTDGDGICDTPADPKLGLSNVDNGCQYTGNLKDANGEVFNPDTSNMMSYTRKSCRSHFSPQQLARMYTYYMTTKNYLSCESINANITADQNETCDETLTVSFQALSDNVNLWAWDINGDGITDYTNKNPVHTYEKGVYDVKLTVYSKNKVISRTYKNFIKVGTETTVLLDENFNDFSMIGDHGWTSNDTSGNGYLWYTNKGNTQTEGTGPSNYLNEDNSLNTYLYAEASGAQPGDVTQLISPCIFVENSNSAIEFAYHMFGKNLGELHVDIKTENGYINDVVTLFGSQQSSANDAFETQTINLAAYTGDIVKIRFRAVRGQSWAGDIAIDNVFVKTIADPITDEVFRVFPNPVKNSQIYIRNNDNRSAAQFKINNLVGQTFLSGVVVPNQPIDVSNLPSGTYLVTIKNANFKRIKKIIK